MIREMPGIELSSVRKSFGATEALRGVSFRVAPGEIYGLLGPNGAGKTTAINILCGLIRPDSGTAKLSGQDVGAGSVDPRRSLGVVPQEPALYMEMSARQNLAFFGRPSKARLPASTSPDGPTSRSNASRAAWCGASTSLRASCTGRGWS